MNPRWNYSLYNYCGRCYKRWPKFVRVCLDCCKDGHRGSSRLRSVPKRGRERKTRYGRLAYELGPDIMVSGGSKP